MAKPGEVRFDDEGNNHVWEDDDVTKYWLDHYIIPFKSRDEPGGCVLCKGSNGIIEVRSGRHFCICPNGQVMRYYLKTVPERT